MSIWLIIELLKWSREIVGWLLLAVGLYLFYVAYFIKLNDNKYVQGFLITLMGIIVFRGGIHLLKVALAARVATIAPNEERGRLRPSPGRQGPTAVVPRKRTQGGRPAPSRR